MSNDWRLFRHVREQGTVVGAMASAAIRGVARTARPRPVLAPEAIPGPTFHGVAHPPSRALVRDFLLHVGGDPTRYENTLPPSLFPQWTFPLSTMVLARTGWPLHRILNAGCSVTVHGPLLADQPIELAARLTAYDDDGRRVRMEQTITMRSNGAVAVVATLATYLPLPRTHEKPAEGTTKRTTKGTTKKESARVPTDARAIGTHVLDRGAGRAFAALTGDVNPIHLFPAAAKLAGFPGCILHGFGSFARVFASLERSLGEHDRSPVSLSLQFVKPLVLPRAVLVFVNEGGEVFLGEEPGAEAYATGTFVGRGPST
jgi:acyl dehydratase